MKPVKKDELRYETLLSFSLAVSLEEKAFWSIFKTS
jgi:hypothetical protein